MRKWSVPQTATARSCVALAGVLLVLSMTGCSAKSSRKAPGPEKAEIKGVPCTTKCCCRTVDGYYRRHECTAEEACSAAGGECLAPDTARCRH